MKTFLLKLLVFVFVQTIFVVLTLLIGINVLRPELLTEARLKEVESSTSVSIAQAEDRLKSILKDNLLKLEASIRPKVTVLPGRLRTNIDPTTNTAKDVGAYLLGNSEMNDGRDVLIEFGTLKIQIFTHVCRGGNFGREGRIHERAPDEVRFPVSFDKKCHCVNASVLNVQSMTNVVHGDNRLAHYHFQVHAHNLKPDKCSIAFTSKEGQQGDHNVVMSQMVVQIVAFGE